VRHPSCQTERSSSFKDVDIATKESLDAAERVFREAAATSTGDFLRFQIDEEADLSSATGKKFRVTVYCGARQLSSFKMDLSISGELPDPEELDIARASSRSTSRGSVTSVVRHGLSLGSWPTRSPLP